MYQVAMGCRWGSIPLVRIFTGSEGKLRCGQNTVLYGFFCFLLSRDFAKQVEIPWFFPNSVSLWGLQPRIAPACTGAGAGSGATRFRRRFRRFRRRSGRLWCRARSGSTGFRRRLQRRSRRRFSEFLVQGQVRFNGFRRRFWRSLFFFFLFSWLCSTLQRDRCGCWGYHRSLFGANQSNTL